MRVALLLAVSMIGMALAGCSGLPGTGSDAEPQPAKVPDLRCLDGDLQIDRSPSGAVTHNESLDFTVDVPDDALGLVWIHEDVRAEGATFRHVFDAPGTKHVEARAFTPDGCVLVGSMDVAVENEAPIAFLDYKEVGGDLVLDASGSKDPNGDALTYAWTIDGRPVGSGQKALTAAPADGAIIEVVVTDAFGGTDTDKEIYHA